MITLNSTVRKLELDLAGASSLPCAVIVSFIDRRTQDQQDASGTQLSTSNGTSDVTICDAPRDGMTRDIQTISIYNPNGSSVVARVYYDESGTEYTIVQTTLTSGDTLFYEDE